MCVGWGASTPYKEIARMEIEQKHAVKLEIPKIEKSNLSRAFDYYRKISYHRGLVLEGIRLCAMRNRGFWHGIYEELLQEKRRPVKREVVEERIRNIQKERGEAAYQQVLREYNNQRIEAGLDPAKDGGPFWVAHEVKSSMEQRLVVPITFFSWEIYMCLLYVEIEAYRSHTARIPELGNKGIDKFFRKNRRILGALKEYRDKVLHPQAKVSEEQVADRFFDLLENTSNNEIDLVITIQRMIDCHIQGVGLGIIQSMDAELVELLDILKSGQRLPMKGHDKFEVWMDQIGYITPNTNLMTPEQFGGTTREGQAPNLSMTNVVGLVSRMMEHRTKRDGPTGQGLELPGDTGYGRMLMRAFILMSEGMGLVDTAKLLGSEDPRTLPLSEIWKTVKEGAEPETRQEVQNLMALERVAIAMIHEPIRTYHKMVKRHRVRVPEWMAQSIPTEKTYQKLRDFRNVVFHVKVEKHSPDKLEWGWIQHTAKHPTIDIIHALLTFYGFGNGFEELRARARDNRGV